MSNWTSKFAVDVTKAGAKRLSNGPNCALVLNNDPFFKGKIRFNIFAGAVEVLFPEAGGTDEIWRSITDNDISLFANYLSSAWKLELNEAVVFRQVALVAAHNRTDPLVDYLTSLKHDGVTRLDTWLSTYLGVAPTEYTKIIGRRWLIGAVARALRPGCKMDTILILEGAQGIRKSSALAALAGQEFFADTPIDIGSKDGRLALQGSWIVELAELESLRKSESTKTKAFFSQLEDKFRPPYGRVDVRVPRRCVFAGTSNRDDYLQDETGNRRFWPVECGEIILALLRKDRDQLWAEAHAAFTAGEQWWLETVEEAALAEAVADERVEDDPWMSTLGEWLTPRQHAVVTREEIFTVALGKGFDEWDARLNRRAGAALKRLKWLKVRRRLGGDRMGFFYQYDSKGALQAEMYADAEVRRVRAIEVSKLSPFERSEAAKRFVIPSRPQPSA